MKLSISDLRTERQWRASTGYDQNRFEQLQAIFEKKYEEIFHEKLEETKARSPMQSTIQNCEELLFFTLFSLKSGLTYDVLGVVTGMDGTTAKRNQEVGIRVLQEVFQEKGYAPKREFNLVKEFREHFKNEKTLLIDGTEQQIERPKNNDLQKQNYSGKKAHTVKTTVISSKEKKIMFMSYCWVGCTHDFTMLKEDFPPNKNWFGKHKVRLDLGYQGFESEYKCKELNIPKKKPRGGQLSEQDKDKNKTKASERIVVEHSLSGLKRYRILVNKMRLKGFGYYNDILEVCAGLWNYYLCH